MEWTKSIRFLIKKMSKEHESCRNTKNNVEMFFQHVKKNRERIDICVLEALFFHGRYAFEGCNLLDIYRKLPLEEDIQA